MDSLGDVLMVMTAVILVGCLAWGAAAAVIVRRRKARIRSEFGVVPDELLLLGLAELRRAVLAERGEVPDEG